MAIIVIKKNNKKRPTGSNLPLLSQDRSYENNIIAVDFDGTLNTSAYPKTDSPNMKVIEALLARQRAGARIILWTCRNGKELEAAVDACRSWGIVFDAVNDNLPEIKARYGDNPRKISASEYWDDKAVRIG